MSVLATYLHSDLVSHSFMDSFSRVFVHEQQRGAPIFARFAVRSGPMTIVEGRNTAAATLLDQTDCEWLWTIDTDMGFRDDILERMLEFASPGQVPVIGALCHGQFTGKSDGMGGYYRSSAPTLYVKEDGRYTLKPDKGYPEDRLIKVAATGAACMLIHRSALESVREDHGDTWYNRVQRPGDPMPMGEDLSFCKRLEEQGFPIYVHTGIPTTHHKSTFLGQ